MFHVEHRGFMINKANLPHIFLEKMRIYEAELIKWNKKTDLIGNSTINDFYDRHILNSLQFITFLKKNDHTIADIGTGAGLPGIVCAAYDATRKYYLFEKKNKNLFFETYTSSIKVR